MLPRAKLHLTRKSEELLQWRSIFSKIAQIFETCLGICRNTSLTMFLRSVRNFSIEDRVYHPHLLKKSSKHQKNGTKTKIQVFKHLHFSAEKYNCFRFPQVRTASPGCPGPKKRKKQNFTKKTNTAFFYDEQNDVHRKKT